MLIIGHFGGQKFTTRSYVGKDLMAHSSSRSRRPCSLTKVPRGQKLEAGRFRPSRVTLHPSLEGSEPLKISNRKLVILTVGVASVLSISIVGVLLATYLGRAACVQRDPFGFLPPQVNVQNEASLLLALSELGEQGVAPGITCDLKNHLMVYHGEPEGCVALKMEASEPLPSCQELEAYFHAVLRNATLGITSEVQLVGSGSLGSLATLLCSAKPIYLVNSFGPSPRHLMTRFA